MILPDSSSEASPTHPRFNPEVPQEIPEDLRSHNLLSEELFPRPTTFTESLSALAESSTLRYPSVEATTYIPTTSVPPTTTAAATISKMSSFSTHAKSPEMMPLLGQKGAPSKFHGRYDDVKPFIDHYNQLSAAYGLTAAQKCKKVIMYCARSVIDLLEALTSYKSGDWSQLEKDFVRYFDADRVEIRWLISDLDNLTKKWRDRKITNLTKWRKYERQFVTIAGWLEQAGRITASEKARFFWQGINDRLQVAFESKLTLGAVPLSTRITFPIAKVIEVAKATFERDRFDRDLERSSRSYMDLDSDVTDTEDEDDEDSEDEDLREPKKKKKSNKKKKITRMRSTYLDDEEDYRSRSRKKDRKSETDRLALRESARQPRKELDALIKDLGQLSFDDRRYGITYFKALKLDPDIAQCFQSPKIYQEPAEPPRRSYPQGNMDGRRQYPAQAQYTGPNNQEYGPMRCYGCGKLGHSLRDCHKIQELVASGKVTRDRYGKLVTKDGQQVFRRMGETLVEAIERETSTRTAQSHYYAFSHSHESEYDSDDEATGLFVVAASDYDSDSEDESDYDTLVYAADRGVKKIAQSRKDILDGVYPPPLKRKENVPPPQNESNPKSRPGYGPLSSQTRPHNPPPVATRASEQASRIPRPQYQPAQLVQPLRPSHQPQQVQPVDRSSIPVQTPFDARRPRFLPPDTQEDDDIVMKDGTRPKKPLRRFERPDRIAQEQAEYVRPKIVRKAEISTDLTEQQVIRNILSTPVTLPMREVLASSKELSDQLSDMIKRKNTVAPVTTNAPAPARAARALLYERSEEKLITLNMMCGDKPITAIIDTGSQLNVVSEECWKQAVGMPLDMKQTIDMNDANGGKETLAGLVSNVPLRCGAVKTIAHLYISRNAPFDLLLGRPWQMDNRVCIDERKDGTYLQFKDPNSYQPRYEVLVNPENIGVNPTVEHKRHKGSARSMFIQIQETLPPGTQEYTSDDDETPPLMSVSDSEEDDSASEWEGTDTGIYEDPLQGMGHYPNRFRRIVRNWHQDVDTGQTVPGQPRAIEIEDFHMSGDSSMTPAEIHVNEDSPLSACSETMRNIGNNDSALLSLMEKVTYHIKIMQDSLDTHIPGPNQPMDAHIPSPLNLFLETHTTLPPSAEGCISFESSQGYTQIEQAISDRSRNLPTPAHSLLGVSSHAVRFPTQRDEAGRVFEQGLALNTSIFYVDPPGGPPAIRTGHLIYRLYPDLEVSHGTATPGPRAHNEDFPLSPLVSPSPLLSSLFTAPPLVDPGGLQADADGAERDRSLRHDNEPLDDSTAPHTLLGHSDSADTHSLLFHPDHQLEDAPGLNAFNDACIRRVPTVNCYHLAVPHTYLPCTTADATPSFPAFKTSLNGHVPVKQPSPDTTPIKTEPLDGGTATADSAVAPPPFRHCNRPSNPPLMYSPLSLGLDTPPNTPVSQDELVDSTLNNSFPPIETMKEYLGSGRHASLPPITTIPLCIDPRLVDGPTTRCDEDDIDSDDVAMWDDDEYSDDTSDGEEDMELTSSDDPLDEDYVRYLQRFPAAELDLPELVGPSPHNTFMSIQEHHTITPFEYANSLADAQFPRNSDIPPMVAISHDGSDEVRCDLSDCRERERQAAQSSGTAALAYTIFTCSYSLEQVFDRDAGSRTICKYHLTLLRYIRSALRCGIHRLGVLFKGPTWHYFLTRRPDDDHVRMFFLDKQYVKQFSEDRPFPLTASDSPLLDAYDKYYILHAVHLFRRYGRNYLANTIEYSLRLPISRSKAIRDLLDDGSLEVPPPDVFN